MRVVSPNDNVFDAELDAEFGARPDIHAPAGVEKGDAPGHEFHGNQYSGGSGGDPAYTKLRNSAAAYQTNPGDDRARAALTVACQKTLHGGEYEHLHPGEITVYRAGGIPAKGISFSSSLAQARKQLFVGQSKITSIKLTTSDPAINMNRLVGSSRYSHEREVFVDARNIDRSRFSVTKADLDAAELQKARKPKPLLDPHGNPVKINPARETPVTKQSKSALEASLLRVFQRQKDKAKDAANRLMKADPNPDEVAKQVAEAVEAEWAGLPEEVRQLLEDSYQEGTSNGIRQLSITDTDMIDGLNQTARDWAKDRAAELVGKRVLANGQIIDNPNPKWAISDTTRDDIQRIVTKSFESDTPLKSLIGEIEDAAAFSPARAEMVARTEVMHAMNHGNLDVWKESGQVTALRWDVSSMHPDGIGCACEDNDGVVIGLGDVFPSGDEVPPAHPSCFCDAVAVGFVGDEEEDN